MPKTPHSYLFYVPISFPIPVQGFITSSWDKKLAITEVETGKKLRVLEGHEKSIFWCDYNPKAHLIASCGADKGILIWNPLMREKVAHPHALPEHDPRRPVLVRADQRFLKPGEAIGQAGQQTGGCIVSIVV